MTTCLGVECGATAPPRSDVDPTPAGWVTVFSCDADGAVSLRGARCPECQKRRRAA